MMFSNRQDPNFYDHSGVKRYKGICSWVLRCFVSHVDGWLRDPGGVVKIPLLCHEGKNSYYWCLLVLLHWIGEFFSLTRLTYADKTIFFTVLNLFGMQIAGDVSLILKIIKGEVYKMRAYCVGTSWRYSCSRIMIVIISIRAYQNHGLSLSSRSLQVSYLKWSFRFWWPFTRTGLFSKIIFRAYRKSWVFDSRTWNIFAYTARKDAFIQLSFARLEELSCRALWRPINSWIEFWTFRLMGNMEKKPSSTVLAISHVFEADWHALFKDDWFLYS